MPAGRHSGLGFLAEPEAAGVGDLLDVTAIIDAMPAGPGVTQLGEGSGLDLDELLVDFGAPGDALDLPGILEAAMREEGPSGVSASEPPRIEFTEVSPMQAVPTQFDIFFDDGTGAVLSSSI